jgi:hypothetical protein
VGDGAGCASRLHHCLRHQPGGVGRDGVRHFYANHLVGKFFPPDVEIVAVDFSPEPVGCLYSAVSRGQPATPGWPLLIMFA